MKIFVVLFLFCWSACGYGFAQQFKRIFLFDDFVEAKIQFKNRVVSTSRLNYDASNKTMLFYQGEEMMELTSPWQIDTVSFGERKFVPASKGFHEVVQLKNGTAHIDWLLKEVNIGSKGALGAVTQSNVHSLQMTDLGLNAASMYTPYKWQERGSQEVYRKKSDNTYYFQKNGKLNKVKTVKHLQKLFPLHKEAIHHFVKENGIDMRIPADALCLIDYCLGLDNNGLL